MDGKQSQQHRQHFTLSESTKQMLEVLTAQRYPGRQRRQSQFVEDLITEAFMKEHSMNSVTTAMYGPEPEDQFLKEVRLKLLEIEAEISQLAQLLTNDEIVEQMYRQVHTIAGVASIMDFPLITQVAHEMEELLGEILDGQEQLTEQTLRFLQRMLKRLWRLIDSGGRDVDEVPPAKHEKRSSSPDAPGISLPVASRCPSCTQTIQGIWKHCAYCGTSLVRLCSRCGTVQPHFEGIRFCYECGNQLV